MTLIRKPKLRAENDSAPLCADGRLSPLWLDPGISQKLITKDTKDPKGEGKHSFFSTTLPSDLVVYLDDRKSTCAPLWSSAPLRFDLNKLIAKA